MGKKEDHIYVKYTVHSKSLWIIILIIYLMWDMFSQINIKVTTTT